MTAAEEWARTLKDTIAKLQEIVRAEWPDAKRHPSDLHLYDLATRIDILRRIKAKRGDSRIKAKRGDRPKPSRRTKSALAKTGRAFLKELGNIVPWSSDEPPECKIVLFDRRDIELVAETRTFVKLVLADFAGGEPTDPARYLEEAFIRAWQRARIRSSVTREETPMCQAVASALKLAGIKWTAATVSDHLRGRENRPRSGSLRKKGGRKKP